MAFHTKMEEVRDELIALGHEVLIPELANEAPAAFGGDKKVYFGEYVEKNGGIDAFPAEHDIWDLKEDAIKDHFKKIERCDAVLITNYEKRGVEGYIGGNTLIEIGLAYYLKKKIYVLHPVSSTLSYKVEILGMKPVILEGDVCKISDQV